jgi:hypothetical protein
MAPEEQAFVQKREYALGFHAGFMDAAKCADGERRIKRRGEAFP